MNAARARDFGLSFGVLPTGAHNSVSDVPGVTVGHRTVNDGTHRTGVTVLLPCPEDPFTHKLTAACHVLNGFGKSAGLMQIAELGTLESPVALTNTLNVGLVSDALVEYLARRSEAEGVPLRSVNPVVLECNDGTLSDIRHRAVTQEHVFSAIRDASPDFSEGAVGAGRGMICHGLKGGIGSASRLLRLGGRDYTLGVLVLTNHGKLEDLQIGGVPVGARLADSLRAPEAPDKGSCIVVAATDLPLSSRQLGRVVRRAAVGLHRLGSYIGQGSGEVFLGFSTANRFPEGDARDILPCAILKEERLDLPFRAAAEATEEAVLNSLFAAETVTGYDGTVVRSLRELWRP
ncbi:MAG TPA: P1 family peptidase [Oscillospiraceae bacterium]|nr:P1 family peptidase [Oscillospiraceae bacterium]